MPPPPSPEAGTGGRGAGKRLRWILVAWPAFLSACVLEMLVFALVDPASLRWFGGEPIDLSATTIYSLSFLAFWWVICLSGGITQLLQLGADEVNAEGSSSTRERWPGR